MCMVAKDNDVQLEFLNAGQCSWQCLKKKMCMVAKDNDAQLIRMDDNSLRTLQGLQYSIDSVHQQNRCEIPPHCYIGHHYITLLVNCYHSSAHMSTQFCLPDRQFALV